jgi:hypothetical protein
LQPPKESDQDESPQSDILLPIEEEEPTKLAKRERLKNLVRRMRDLLPRMKVCLPAFQARIQSIETELAQEEDGDDDLEPESATAEDETTNVSEENNNDRQSIAASHADLSIVTPEFKQESNDDGEDLEPESATAKDETTNVSEKSYNDRQSTAGSLVDLSIVTPEFKQESNDDGEDFEPESATAVDETTNVSEKSYNDRQSTAASHVDLSGTWRPIVTNEFKQEYDQYLLNCSESYMFRKLIVNGISLQKEIIRQSKDGALMQIVASNPAGNWNRTLVAFAEPTNVTVKDPYGDVVQVEAWWGQEGTVHKSWLRDKPRMLGGAFETARYLESENVLVCESSFHPSPTASASTNFKYGHVVWKFKREE